MADLLRDGLAWLTGQLTAHASQTVTYTRGADSVEVPATFGAKLLRLSEEFGVRLEWTDLDFLIPAASLVLASEAITPRRGDTITVVIGDEAQTFEVFPFGDEPPWRWSDPHQSMLRIHTKHIGTQAYY